MTNIKNFTKMKELTKFILGLFVVSGMIVMSSCEKDEKIAEPRQDVYIGFSVSDEGGEITADVAKDNPDLSKSGPTSDGGEMMFSSNNNNSDPAEVTFKIEGKGDLDDFEQEYTIDLVEYGDGDDDYVTEGPISLVPGDYKVTKFEVADNDDNRLYLAPREDGESEWAQIVDNPLPVNFEVNADEATEVSLEGVDVQYLEAEAEDFGYPYFTYEFVDAFRFQLSVFELDGGSHDFVDDGDNVYLTIKNDTDEYYSYEKFGDSDLIEGTNDIFLPTEHDGDFTIYLADAENGDKFEIINRDNKEELKKSQSDLEKYFTEDGDGNQGEGPLVLVIDGSTQ